MRCPVHLSIGQEAPAVGVCANLTREDYAMGSHRAHAHYLAKGGRLKPMIAEFYGREAGCSRGKGGSMHLIDIDEGFLGATPIVGSSLPLAVGAAFGASMKGEKRVSTVFFGEGTTEEGILSECLNFAALKKLPVLFVCENNFFSVYSPLFVRQPKERDLMGIVRAHGVHAASGDGNNVEEVYRLSKEAVERAREGLGPSLLLFETYRWREHCGPYYDNDKGYRSEEEFQKWRLRCPIENYQKKLIAEGIISEKDIADKMENVRSEIQEAFVLAKASPYPAKEMLFSGLYEENLK